MECIGDKEILFTRARVFSMNIFTSILLINNSGGQSAPAEPEEAWLTGWGRRKQFSVAATVEIESILQFTIYNTAGTDTTTAVYLDGNVRADWGDIRFTTNDKTTRLDWAILKKNADNILVSVNLGTVQNGVFYLYYDGPAASLFKIGNLTDVHYDTGATVDNRNLSLDMIDNFVTRMQTYLPDLAVHCGDKTGASSSSEATQLTWYDATVSRFATVAPYAGEVLEGIAPGNHDFDFISYASVQSRHVEAWRETGTLYGAKEVGPYLIVTLDAYYTPNTQTHQSLDNAAHQGFGYVNTNQLTWLTSTLAAATKPVILFIHQPCGEFDTDQFTLDKETYHTQNRAAIRDILEASQKVVCVLHGHMHYSRNDVINGIPYIAITNIGQSGQFGEQPATNTGKWGLIELDSSARTIKVTTEAVVSGVVQVIYEQTLPFGHTTILSHDIGSNHDDVYAYGYAANFEKSSFLRDPTQMYVLDDAHLYKYPTNLNIPDPHLSEHTIKIVGRTNTPNFGRVFWYYAPQSGTIRIRFDARISTVKTKFIKFGDANVQNNPAFRVHFKNDGNISAFNGAVDTALRTYTAPNWYAVEIIANVAAQTYSVWVDSVLEAENFAFQNAINPVSRMEITTETGNLYIDNMKIEKYTDIAVTAFGSEELAP